MRCTDVEVSFPQQKETIMKYSGSLYLDGSATLTIMTGLLLCVLLVVDSALSAEDSVYARIADFKSPLTIHRSNDRPPFVGLELRKNDTVVVAQEGMATLVFPDGVVQVFDGPTVITSASDRKGQQGFVSKLTSALANVIFPGKDMPDRVRLAVRGAGNQELQPTALPVLVSPPYATLLMDRPSRFLWQPINGASSYTIILSDQKHILWEMKTQSAGVEALPDSSFFAPGGTYFWTVEAEIGRTVLQSEQATFGIIDLSHRAAVLHAMQELNELSIDSRLATLLRVSIYHSHSLLEEEFREVENLLVRWPNDYNGLLLKARLLETMHLYQDAARYYRQALGQ